MPYVIEIKRLTVKIHQHSINFSAMALANNRTRIRSRRRPSSQPSNDGGMSPREYQARMDLCRLWDLMQQRKSSAEIAREMGKDPAWVCRSIQRIQDDFSTIYPRPDEAKTILTNLANLESLLAEILRTIPTVEGGAKISAIRAASDLIRQKSDYEIRVGRVASRKRCTLGYNFDDAVEKMFAAILEEGSGGG